MEHSAKDAIGLFIFTKFLNINKRVDTKINTIFKIDVTNFPGELCITVLKCLRVKSLRYDSYAIKIEYLILCL